VHVAHIVIEVIST